MKIKFKNMGFIAAILFIFFLIADNASAYFVDHEISEEAYAAAYWNWDYTPDGKWEGEAAWAGEFTFDFYADDDTVMDNLLFSSYGFCVDLYGGANDGFADLEGLNGWSWSDTIKGQLAWLLDTHWSPGTMSKYENAGMQLAIWDIIYSGSDPDDDKFRPYDDNSDTYDKYVEYVDGLDDTGNISSYRIINFNRSGQADNDYQEFITIIPEPGTFMLFGLGLLTIFGVGRKKTSLLV